MGSLHSGKWAVRARWILINAVRLPEPINSLMVAHSELPQRLVAHF